MVSRNEEDTFIDNAPRQQFSQGDELAVNGKLFRRGHRVGRVDVYATFTEVGPGETAALQITFTATLPQGQITATGVAGPQDQAGFEAAITGGTGAYSRARGEVRVVLTGPTTSELTYHLQ